MIYIHVITWTPCGSPWISDYPQIHLLRHHSQPFLPISHSSPSAFMACPCHHLHSVRGWRALPHRWHNSPFLLLFIQILFHGNLTWLESIYLIINKICKVTPKFARYFKMQGRGNRLLVPCCLLNSPASGGPLGDTRSRNKWAFGLIQWSSLHDVKYLLKN